MENIFITELNIRKVRHLIDINIPLSRENRKNLILTGKNGSGKTSVLKTFAEHLEYIVADDFYTEAEAEKNLLYFQKLIDENSGTEVVLQGEKDKFVKRMLIWRHYLTLWQSGCIAKYTSMEMLREKYKKGQFVLAYYSDSRKINIAEYRNIEKVKLKPFYTIKETPSSDLGKYLVDLKSTQAFAKAKGDTERADQIADWFERFENILRRIYQDNSLKLDFDIDY